MTLDGIDVSHYQTTTPSLAGRSFVFARATYDTVPDGMYPTHAANVRAAGLTLGAYHFGTARSTVAAQVDAFLATADTELLALDLESDRSVITTMTNAQAGAFIAEVHRRGHRIGLYHSDSGFPSLGQDWNWVAKWGTAPPVRPWAFWQYRGSPLDLDHFNGDQTALDALACKETPMPAFDVTGTESAVLTVKGSGHAVVALDDTSKRAAIADGATKTGHLPIKLHAPLDSNPGDRRSAWLVQHDVAGVSRASFLLASDVTAVPTPPPADTTPYDQDDINLAVKTEHDRWVAWKGTAPG